MQDFTNKKIVLGICGGIAAYKSAYLVRELTRLGAQVRVVMTKSAQEFISPLTFQALSGHEVRTTLFDPQAEKAMGHIELARWADYLLIAPASANTMAKLAHGQADDLLTTLYLVAQTPVIVCPAMNQSMWSHPATQENKQILAKRGVIIVGPAAGSQACGEEGYGRMSEPDSIINALRLTSIANCLQGKKVLITAGPTEEAIDPVRFVSNHSSGKMGYALAEAAKIAGAEVTLISGPTAIQPPDGVIFHRVKTAKEMHKVVFTHLQSGMIFIGCAAVADFGVTESAADKIKKTSAESTLVVNLTANPDIISEVAFSGKAEFVLGFAAETTNVLAHAKAKLQAKKMHMVVANQVGHGMAFDQDCNKVTVISEDSQVDLPLTHKVRIAGEIVAILAATLQNAPLAK